MEPYLECILPTKRKSLSRNCKNCKELFLPDARNRHHQQYCGNPECRRASKGAAQERWLKSAKGAGYFSGPDNVDRVRDWREKNLRYWDRKKVPPVGAIDALQDLSKLQVIENKSDPEISQNYALQDICFTQPALIIGLIANLTGNTLQDDIANTSRRFIDFGRDILGKATPKLSTS